ncbi:MAG: ABC transporter permease [Planctomycetaceae bacterium]|nr:ABC transporter permease [Planctomycetaceae bacterium]
MKNDLLKKRFRGSHLEVVIFSIISVAIFLCIWWAISTGGRIGRFFPNPAIVIERFFQSFVVPIGRNTMWGHIFFSLQRVVIGYLLAVAIGIPLGLIMACSRLGKAIFMPLFSIVRPIPGLAWIPLAILWFGVGENSKYFLICMTALVGITIQTFYGALYVDPVLLGAGRMLGANRVQLFVNVVIPSAFPQIFAGLQGSFANAWCAVIAAEMIRSDEGTGWIIFNGMNSTNTQQILVGMVAIGMVGYVIAELLKVLERKLCAWKIQGQ